jgi:hypothetical protein
MRTAISATPVTSSSEFPFPEFDATDGELVGLDPVEHPATMAHAARLMANVAAP